MNESGIRFGKQEFEEDFGKPLHNLKININVDKDSLQNMLSLEDRTIEHIDCPGDVMVLAYNLIGGARYVTNKGYLLSGHEKSIKTRNAVFDINANFRSLIHLNEVFRKKVAFKKYPTYLRNLNKTLSRKLGYIDGSCVYIYYKDNKNSENIRTDGFNLYFPRLIDGVN